MLTGRKQQKNKELTEFGMTVGTVSSDEKHSRLFSCIMKGLLVFCAVFGTIESLMSAFSISYNKALVGGILLLLSVYVGLMYMKKLWFYLGYVILMLLFAIELVRYQRYVNSGYQAVLNLIHKEYSEYYRLGITREATELFSNRHLTITLLLIFIGFALVIFLNIAISGYMNIFLTVLLTAPLVEVAFFIGKNPNLLPLSLLGSVYITVAFLQCSRNARMLIKKKNTEYLQKKGRKRITFSYQGNGTSIFFLLAAGFCLTFLILLILKPMQSVEDKERVSRSVLRKRLDERVETFVLTGFTGLFNRYQATGGLSSGRLGGVGNVRPDFKTDLVVSFVPYSLDTVYLRSFIGTEYTENSFHSSGFVMDVEERKLKSYNMDRLDSYEEDFMPSSDAVARMEIEEVDFRSTLPLLPYTSFRKNTVKKENNQTVLYAPYFSSKEIDEKKQPDEDYLLYVNQACLSLSPDQRLYLEKWCEENSIPAYQDISGSAAEKRSRTLSVAEAIRSVFYENYPYTMSPGATKRNQDFVEFFLTKQKRGYCAHFAAASVLILRSLGIPARYVEGYCMPNNLVADGEILTGETVADWYQGSSEFETKNVVSVEVNDAYAHAWTEIYVEGYGFIPFEFTPPSDGEEMTQTSFLSRLFSGLFDSVNLNANEANDGLTGEDSSEDGSSVLHFSIKSIFFPIFLFLLFAIAAMVLILTVRLLTAAILIARLWKREEYEKIITVYYQKLLKTFLKKGKSEVRYPLPEQIKTEMNEIFPERRTENEEFIKTAELAAFSGEAIGMEKAQWFVLQYKGIKKLLRKYRMKDGKSRS